MRTRRGALLTRTFLLGMLLCVAVLATPAGAQEGPAYLNVPVPVITQTNLPNLQPTVLGSRFVQQTPAVSGELQPGVLGARGVLGSTGFAVTGGDVLGLLGFATVAVILGIGIVRVTRPRAPAKPS